eukprot:TRINITY_DN119_c0_g1_i6.p1 TRINITY_DN119_c0_g1~~TRINITY_DN119_c0_g1_i6.p1  ORF type:complete len:333 (-),score=88.77 TRINITY_DN119_c0_g1_i6:733-1731(-)
MANKFLLILCALFFIALCIDGTEAKKTFGSCNCKARAVQRCSSDDNKEKCAKRYNRRCTRRCKQIRKQLPACNCSTKAIKKCGASGSSKARDCRNNSIYSCLRKLEKKVSRSIKIKLINDKPPKKSLTTFTKRAAVRQCGKGEVNKQCRIEARKEIRQREIKFRKTVLDACACRAKLSQRCQDKPNSKKCIRRYNRCARRCLRRACNIRGKLECISHNKKTKCRKTVSESCRRVNKIKKARKVQVKRDTIIVSKINLSKSFKAICEKAAVRKCGAGAVNKPCRIQVKKQIKKRERTFRKNSLKACSCRTKLSKRCRRNLKKSGCTKKQSMQS